MDINFNKFKKSLPYASEMYGIYQPLLGWKSKRIVQRFKPGFSFADATLQRLASRLQPQVTVREFQDGVDVGFPPKNVIMDESEYVIDVAVATPKGIKIQLAPGLSDSLLLRHLAKQMEHDSIPLDATRLASLLTVEALNQALYDISILQIDTMSPVHAELGAWINMAEVGDNDAAKIKAVQDIVERESLMAGVLLELVRAAQFDQLIRMFSGGLDPIDMVVFEQMRRLIDPLENFDVKTDLDKVVLSPIGVVHLFRQYFFEFDTFLGPSVQHIWLSPGSKVELIEISTRRSTLERNSENSSESAQRMSNAGFIEDEFADAIRQNNSSQTHFGVSVETDSDIVVPFFTSEIQTSTNYDMNTSAQIAKENVHKQLRQESSSVAMAVRKNYRTTFKSVTETETVSSKKYLLANDTQKLVNYELRRKMRQVGVQVQDIGTHLCWQTYVDLPGDQLLLPKLMHIAKPENLDLLPNPEEMPMPAPELKAEVIRGSFVWDFPDDKPVLNDPAHNMAVFQRHIISPPKEGYVFDRYEIKKVQGNTFWLEARIVDQRIINNAPDFGTALVGIVTGPEGIRWDERVEFAYELTIFYKPTPVLFERVRAENERRKDQVKAENSQRTEEAYFKLAKDRINAERAIVTRKFEDLREEERIIVYRNLIRQLLKETGFGGASAPTQHILAELVQSMFDIKKMLYFVAPEWWSPRHHATQDIDNKSFIRRKDMRRQQPSLPTNPQRPTYDITENSNPAPMGSSLGWLLQLDGDKQRNAFLNAPWVKAVIPIRSGKELAALNWLTQNIVEGTTGLDARYQEGSLGEKEGMLATLRAFNWNDTALNERYATLSPDDMTLNDAIRCLALRVQAKFFKSKMALPSDPAEPDLGGYLPTEKLFETGFDPIGGFKAQGEQPFEVFSQWLEVVPTDQVVAVEVTYDPKTGMQL
jgi:hypothetical protein